MTHAWQQSPSGQWRIVVRAEDDTEVESGWCKSHAAALRQVREAMAAKGKRAKGRKGAKTE